MSYFIQWNYKLLAITKLDFTLQFVSEWQDQIVDMTGMYKKVLCKVTMIIQNYYSAT